MNMRIIVALIIVLFSASASASEESSIEYGTWSPWEPDAILAAWALKNFVHNNARFSSYEKNTAIDALHSIDIPSSPYSRNGKTTAFQQVVEINNIESPCIQDLITISRILEIAPWRKSQYADAADFETEIGPFIPRTPQKDGLEQAFKVIDGYCTKFTQRK